MGYILKPAQLLLILLLIFLGNTTAQSQIESGARQYRGLDSALQLLKQQELELERDLLILEEQVTNPLVIYFSMDTDHKFKLDSLTILLDGKKLTAKEYNAAIIKNLRRGSAQLVFKGSIAQGKHELIAYYTSNRDYQRGSKLIIEKTIQPKFLEIVIQKQDSKESRLQPELMIREWNKP